MPRTEIRGVDKYELMALSLASQHILSNDFDVILNMPFDKILKAYQYCQFINDFQSKYIQDKKQKKT